MLACAIEMGIQDAMNLRHAITAAVAVLMFNLSPLVARDVTLTVGGSGLSEISIETNETAEVVSWFPQEVTGTQLDIIKDGLTISFNSSQGLIPRAGALPVRIAGPAIIRFIAVSGGSPSRGFCTVKVEPATFPPDRTLVVPADTGGANISLEVSTNLVHWTTATPGAYTNLQSHMFFRIRAERLP